MTLQEWIPEDLDPRSLPKTQRNKIIEMLDAKIIKEHSDMELEGNDLQKFYRSMPFPHVNIHSWVELDNGYAVAFNENPSRGWSLPIKRINNN